MYISLTERLKNQHTAIIAIAAELDEERLTYHPAPGKWNIHDNIAHLARYQPVFTERAHQILITDSPVFQRYNADEDSGFNQLQTSPLTELLNKITTDRDSIFQLITGLPPEKLARKGVHPKYGNLTLLEWTEFFLLHEAHHLFTIFQLAHAVV